MSISPRSELPRGAADFLPGLLEIQQRPPSPAGRLLLWALIALLLVALGWAIRGRVDIIATARGKVVTSGREQLVQPLVEGVVVAIHVHEGDRVAAGEPLVELDPTPARAALEQTRAALDQARRDAGRIRRVLQRLEQPQQRDTGEGEDPVQRALRQSQVAAIRARLQSLDREQESQQAALAAARAEARKYRDILPLQRKRSAQLQKLVRRRLHPEAKWLEVEEAYLRTERELQAQQARTRQIEAELRRLEATRQSEVATFRRDTLERLSQADQRVRQLEQELTKGQFRLEHTRLEAPIAGVVQELAVHTIGGVVQPAQVLMRIVPQEEPLEVEAWLRNRDIGFLRPGQEARIKVDTFPFTRYGVLEGHIDRISADAERDGQDRWLYRSRVALARDWLEVEGQRVRLSPGMAVTVEVRTGERRIIEFLLSPLLRLHQESLRER